MFEAKDKEHEEFDKIMADSSYLPELDRSRLSIQSHLNISNNTYYDWKRASGTFDIREAFLKDQEKIWNTFMDGVKNNKISPGLFRTFAQLVGELVERKEESIKVEFSVSDRIRIASQLRDELRREWETSGSCAVCGQSSALRNQVRSNTEPEFSENREVGTVGLSIRPV